MQIQLTYLPIVSITVTGFLLALRSLGMDISLVIAFSPIISFAMFFLIVTITGILIYSIENCFEYLVKLIHNKNTN